MDRHDATEQAYSNGYAAGFADAKKLYQPCQIGQRVWGIRKYNGASTLKYGRVNKMEYNSEMEMCVTIKNSVRGVWGKDVFATQEEALAMMGKTHRAIG